MRRGEAIKPVLLPKDIPRNEHTGSGINKSPEASFNMRIGGGKMGRTYPSMSNKIYAISKRGSLCKIAGLRRTASTVKVGIATRDGRE